MPAAPPTTRRRSKRPKSFQHTARVLVLQVLYEVDVTGHDWRDSLGAHTEATGASERVVDFAEKAIQGVLASLPLLDQLISTHAPMFPVDQLSPVDRTVLRLALYELLPDSSVPMKVAINEAIELAKMFGGEGSPRFVNGVLGAALQELDTARTNPPD